MTIHLYFITLFLFMTKAKVLNNIGTCKNKCYHLTLMTTAKLQQQQ